MKTSIKVLISLLVFNLLVGFLLLNRVPPTIENLIDPNTRVQAYQNLLKRSQTEQTFSYKDHNALLISKIPVKDVSLQPLYLILRDFRYPRPKPPWNSWESARKISEWKNWVSRPRHKIVTPPLDSPTAIPLADDYFLTLFTHDGTLIDVDDNSTNYSDLWAYKGEIIFDINQDGWVERISTRYVKNSKLGNSARVIEVKRLNSITKVLFRIAVFTSSNLSGPYRRSKLTKKKNWSYQCTDTNADGNLEIQIGPGEPGSITPKVTFFWNTKTQTFQSPSGTISPYFRVLPVAASWPSDDQTRPRLTYPFDKF